MEHITSLKKDLKILEEHSKKSKLTSGEYFAVLYRSEMKRTMHSQLEMVLFMQGVLTKSQKISKSIDFSVPASIEKANK